MLETLHGHFKEYDELDVFGINPRITWQISNNAIHY